MTRALRRTNRSEVVNVTSSAAIVMFGAWLLVQAAGMVAILAVVIATVLYVPLRCRTDPRHHATAGWGGLETATSKARARQR